MSYTLRILPENEDVSMFYVNHKVAYEGDSGIDLYFPDDVIIPSKSTKLIDLKIKCELVKLSLKDINSPYIGSIVLDDVLSGYYLFPRSSISKTPLRMSNSVGIIDKNYRGNIMVSVDNISEGNFCVKKGVRLFQICNPFLSEMHVSVVDSLSKTERGEGGFGSSGN